MRAGDRDIVEGRWGTLRRSIVLGACRGAREEQTMRMPRVLAVILAGGSGSRMGALTESRAKPALRAAGSYRLIDVALSNLVNSQISHVWLVEEHEPFSLNEYVSGGRAWDLDRTHGGLVVLPPFSGDTEKAGFSNGNSDSLWRQLDRMKDVDPEIVLVLSADHFYTTDFVDLIDAHVGSDADLTMVTTSVAGDASRYSVVDVDDGAVTDFWYKPDNPATNLVAAEIFCFTASELFSALDRLVDELGELGDYGDDLLPWFVENKTVAEHRHNGYWKDLGTLAAYWEAHMDLITGTGLTLDDPEWPIFSAQPHLLPPRIDSGADVSDALIGMGSTIRGSVDRSVISPLCFVDSGATVHESILLDEVRVPAGVTLRRCIVDTGAALKPGIYGNGTNVTLIDADGRVTEDD